MKDNFPDLFSRLPSKYGDGFFGGFDDNFSMRPLAGKVERVVPTTYKPKYAASPSPPPTQYYARTPTTPKYYDRSPTTPKYYDRTPNSYDRYSVDKKPTGQKKVDIEISNSGSSGLSVTPRPPQLYSPSPYPFYTPRHNTPTPYEFYKPTTPANRLDESESLESLPPPDNFPSFQKKPDVIHSPYHEEMPRQPPPQRRPSPLQSLLNPIRNMFSFGGNRYPNHPPGNMRRHYKNRPYGLDEVDVVPEPLPPPAGFPDFKYSLSRDKTPEGDSADYDLGFDIDNRRRRRKRPRRPLFDEKIKQKLETSNNDFQDLMSANKYPSLYREPSRRPALFRKRPLHRNRYMDMDYSPSDKEEILTTALTTQPMKTTVRAKKPSSSLGVGIFNPGNNLSNIKFGEIKHKIIQVE